MAAACVAMSAVCEASSIAVAGSLVMRRKADLLGEGIWRQAARSSMLENEGLTKRMDSLEGALAAALIAESSVISETGLDGGTSSDCPVAERRWMWDCGGRVFRSALSWAVSLAGLRPEISLAVSRRFRRMKFWCSLSAFRCRDVCRVVASPITAGAESRT